MGREQSWYLLALPGSNLVSKQKYQQNSCLPTCSNGCKDSPALQVNKHEITPLTSTRLLGKQLWKPRSLQTKRQSNQGHGSAQNRDLFLRKPSWGAGSCEQLLWRHKAPAWISHGTRGMDPQPTGFPLMPQDCCQTLNSSFLQKMPTPGSLQRELMKLLSQI